MSETHIRPEDKPEFNVSIQLICSNMLFESTDEIKSMAALITFQENMFKESHVNANGRIQPGFIKELECRCFILDIALSGNKKTALKNIEVLKALSKPTIASLASLDDLNKHMLWVYLKDAEDVIQELIEMDLVDGSLAHFFWKMHRRWNARRELTKLAQR